VSERSCKSREKEPISRGTGCSNLYPSSNESAIRRDAASGDRDQGPALSHMPALQGHQPLARPRRQHVSGWSTSKSRRLLLCSRSWRPRAANMARVKANPARLRPAELPQWIKPQLTTLVEEPPGGPEWLHESNSMVTEWTPGWTGAHSGCRHKALRLRIGHAKWDRSIDPGSGADSQIGERRAALGRA
jgi:hypothetical protein